MHSSSGAPNVSAGVTGSLWKLVPSPTLENVVRGVAACIGVVLFLDLLQAPDLLSHDGLWPVADFLRAQRAETGIRAIIAFPSIFWVSATKPFIFSIGLLGAIAAALWAVFPRNMIYGVLALGAWLSFVTVGGDFFQIIWDFYLTECAWIALFTTLALNFRGTPSFVWLRRLVLVCWWLLVFRLWFSMGYVKITSPDPAWRELSYSFWFMQNQPMPAPLAVILHRAPMWFHTVATATILFVELALPFFILLGRRARMIAFVGFACASVAIELSGNFGIFNILSIVTAFALLIPFSPHTDDHSSVNHGDEGQPPIVAESQAKLTGARDHLRVGLSGALACVVTAQIALQLLTLAHLSLPTQEPFQFLRIPAYDQRFLKSKDDMAGSEDGAIRNLWQLSAQWRIANPYGVFNSIARTRLEVRMFKECQQSTWSDIVFRYRPGHRNRSIRYYAPYYPRLDQMLAYESYAIPFHRFSPLNGTWNGQSGPFPATLIEGISTGNDQKIRPLLKQLPCPAEPGRVRVEFVAQRFADKRDQQWDEIVLSELLTTAPSEPVAVLHPMVPLSLLRFAMQDEDSVFTPPATEPRDD